MKYWIYTSISVKQLVSNYTLTFFHLLIIKLSNHLIFDNLIKNISLSLKKVTIVYHKFQNFELPTSSYTSFFILRSSGSNFYILVYYAYDQLTDSGPLMISYKSVNKRFITLYGTITGTLSDYLRPKRSSYIQSLNPLAKRGG